MYTDIEAEEPQKKYGIIYTDPAWPLRKGGLRDCRPNQTRELDYRTDSLPEILEIHRAAFRFCADECSVFMWTTERFLRDAEDIAAELGFVLHARIIWDKGNGTAPAFTLRFSHEYLLWFYRKGHMLKPSPETRGKYTDVLREAPRGHSRKPEAAYLMLEDMFPDAEKLELFARCTRPGWDVWGDQTGLFGSGNGT